MVGERNFKPSKRARVQSRKSRIIDLVQLLPAGDPLDRSTLNRHRALVAKLKCVLKAERRRGLAGHWSYDINRHRALIAAYELERSALSASRSVQARLR